MSRAVQMQTPFFQFSFLCVVALANLCLGFAIASRLGFGPSLAALFQLESAPLGIPPVAPEVEMTAVKTEEPIAEESHTEMKMAVEGDTTVADQLVGGDTAPAPEEDPVYDTAEV